MSHLTYFMLFYANLIFPFFAVFAILQWFFNFLKTVKLFISPVFPFCADVPSVLLIFNKNGKNAREVLKKRSVRPEQHGNGERDSPALAVYLLSTCCSLAVNLLLTCC